MDAKALIALIVQISLVLTVASIGMQGRWSDLLFAWRHPIILLRGILAVNVVVPVVAIIAALTLPMAIPIKVGIIVMAISPLAPFAPGKLLKTGADYNFVVGLYTALLLASIVLLPATFALIRALFGTHAGIETWEVAAFLLQTVFLPLLAGMALAAIAPEFAKRAFPLFAKAGMILLVPVGLIALFVARHALVELIGNGALVAIAAATVAGIASGHMLGGPLLENRMALALAAATRHPGIAGLIIHRNYEDKRVMLTVVLYLLTSVVISSLYQAWAKRHLAKRSGATSEDGPTVQ